MNYKLRADYVPRSLIWDSKGPSLWCDLTQQKKVYGVTPHYVKLCGVKLPKNLLFVRIAPAKYKKNRHSLPQTACKLQFAMKSSINSFETGSILWILSNIPKRAYKPSENKIRSVRF